MEDDDPGAVPVSESRHRYDWAPATGAVASGVTMAQLPNRNAGYAAAAPATAPPRAPGWTAYGSVDVRGALPTHSTALLAAGSAVTVPVPAPGCITLTLTDAQVAALNDEVATWRRTSLALLVMGVLGLVPTLAVVPEVFAILVGVIGVRSARRDALLARAQGARVSGSAPVDGYNLCIALTIAAPLNVACGIALGYYFEAVHYSCNGFGMSRNDCLATQRLFTIFSVGFYLGAAWAIVLFFLAVTYIRALRRICALLGPSVAAGGCCEPCSLATAALALPAPPIVTWPASHGGHGGHGGPVPSAPPAAVL